MKIASSQLSFNADRKYEEKDVSKRVVETLEDRISMSASNRSGRIRSAFKQSSGKISLRSRLFSAYTDVPAASSDDNMPSDPKLAAMKRMLEAMMGKKLKLTDISRLQTTGRRSTGSQSTLSSADSLKQSALKINSQSGSNLTAQSSQATEIPVRRVRITEFNSHYESEATQFKALGSVKTDTGKSINFSLNLEMKREFYSENMSQLTTEATLTDPLVVNFSGQPAELTDVKFKFDLNADGNEEDISWLSSGSGFLVLDKNLDGVINSGNEMFGPATNNGFEELKQLDGDQNGWIDENDAAFEKLSVWSGDTPETAQLKSLKESGIGAIALSSVDTEFSVKDSSQNTLGQLRKTGIYLEENGKAGTIQQLDLAI